MDEAKRIEQDVNQKRKAQIPKKIFLIARERLGEEVKRRLNILLEKYPSLKVFTGLRRK